MHACMISSEGDTSLYASFAVLRESDTNNTAVGGCRFTAVQPCQGRSKLNRATQFSLTI